MFCKSLYLISQGVLQRDQILKKFLFTFLWLHFKNAIHRKLLQISGLYPPLGNFTTYYYIKKATAFLIQLFNNPMYCSFMMEGKIKYQGFPRTDGTQDLLDFTVWCFTTEVQTHSTTEIVDPISIMNACQI